MGIENIMLEDNKCAELTANLSSSANPKNKICRQKGFSLFRQCLGFVVVAVGLAVSGSISVLIIGYNVKYTADNEYRRNNMPEDLLSNSGPNPEFIENSNHHVNRKKSRNRGEHMERGTENPLIEHEESLNLAKKNCFELIINDDDGRNHSISWIQVIDVSRFWIEGVTIPIVAITGLICNTIVFVVLFSLIRISDRGSQRNFDIILLALTIIDILLLIMYMTDSILQNVYIENFSEETFTEPRWYQIIYPHMWHPFKNIITTASHYMILAITIERYLVICHKRKNLFNPSRYIMAVFLFSTLVNIHKFFEFRHDVSDDFPNYPSNRTSNTSSSTNAMYDIDSYEYRTSRIGENPAFLVFNAYHEVCVIVFCLFAICVCNLEICRKIKISGNFKNRFVGTYKKNVPCPTTSTKSRSSQRLLNRNHQSRNGTFRRQQAASVTENPANINHRTFEPSMELKEWNTRMSEKSGTKAKEESLLQNGLPVNGHTSRQCPTFNIEVHKKYCVFEFPYMCQTTASFRTRSVRDDDRSDNSVCSTAEKMDNLSFLDLARNYPEMFLTKVPNMSSGKCRCTGSHTLRRDQGTQTEEPHQSVRQNGPPEVKTSATTDCNGTTSSSVQRNSETLSINNNYSKTTTNFTEKFDKSCSTSDIGETSTTARTKILLRMTSNGSTVHVKQDSMRYFKNMREKSFFILIGIVLIFLICNIPRVLVKIFIISSGGDGKDHFENCLENNRLPVPAFIMIMSNVNHLLIVVDSSVNFLIFCFAAKRFRTAIRKQFSTC